MRKIGLLPFTILYWLITYTRNILFDVGILNSTIIPGKSISVGNLSVGGSGKTPMVNYLTSLLQNEHSIQILSRGYGRKTTGYRHVNSTDDASTVGDEPLSYFQKFAPKTDVFVCEKRQEALVKMNELNPSATIDPGLTCSPIAITPLTSALPVTSKEIIGLLLAIPNIPVFVIRALSRPFVTSTKS